MDKVFWRRSEWWAAVAFPWLATVIDSLQHLISNGNLPADNPVYILLLKSTAILTGLYTLGRAFVKGKSVDSGQAQG